MSPLITTIPLLPCEDFESLLVFWQAMRFTVGYKQKAPNSYAEIKHADGYEIHVFGLKKLAPAENYSTCLVIVPEVETRHAQFLERFRALLGKLPSKGFPRLSRFKPGQTRFTLTDVAGNSVIFIKRGDEDEKKAQEYKQAGLTPLQRALAMAERERDFKNDDAAALRTLDKALQHYNPEKEFPADHARALAMRAELTEALEA